MELRVDKLGPSSLEKVPGCACAYLSPEGGNLHDHLLSRLRTATLSHNEGTSHSGFCASE